jgi:hypothetical protein
MVSYTMVILLCGRSSDTAVNTFHVDLLGVPDRDVWAYGQELRTMAAEKGFENIQIARLRDLIAVDVPRSSMRSPTSLTPQISGIS